MEIRPDFSRWLCREYNERHTEPAGQLERFTVWMVEHGHLLNGSAEAWGRTALWEGRCFASPSTPPAPPAPPAEE